MIDIHCHILPEIDDGATDLSMSLEMARYSVADGVSVIACTPHILPGIYHNSGLQIRQATQQLQQALDERDIQLQLVTGAENHIASDFVSDLRSGHLLTLADSRYVLVETPLHVAPPLLENLFFELLLEGYVPILAHPERLSWIESHYPTIQKLAGAGVWMQITASSIIGAFGRRNLYWAERMLDDRIVHILATDSHNIKRRPPNLSAGRAAAAKWVGDDEAKDMVFARPQGIIDNELPTNLPMPNPASVLAMETSRESNSGVPRGRRASREGKALSSSKSSNSRKLTGWLQRLFE